MRSIPHDIDLAELRDRVAAHWRLTFDSLEYFPHGAGAYHWLGRRRNQRWIVTVDDLDTKPWLGADRETVFAGLLAAYQTARDLRRDAGLSFVVAPEPGVSGGCALRLSGRYSVAVFRFVAGEPGRWGQAVGPEARNQVVRMLALLHQATPAAPSARRHHPHVPGREQLEIALAELDRSWGGGPLAEPARLLLRDHLDVIAGWFLRFDELAGALRRSGGEPSITHGEPHPGNLIRRRDGCFLLDWDTVALAEPERDLWMLDDAAGSVRAAYQDLTGRSIDPRAMALYRLGWKLADLAVYTGGLRLPHERTPDTEWALTAVQRILALDEPQPYEPLAAGGDPAPLA